MRVHEIRNDVGKAYLRQDHQIVLGVLKGIIEGLLPCWLGFNAPNELLMGYGLDHAKDFRRLPYIASL
jgi:hypoxanthine-guanine phosphoribosyltransferase